MAKKVFTVGQVVRLKSGGPDMTVSNIEEPLGFDKTYVNCQWFGGRKLERGRFPITHQSGATLNEGA